MFKKRAVIFTALLLFAMLFSACTHQTPQSTDQDERAVLQPDGIDENDMQILTLRSSVFEDAGMISKRYTCDGENISPPLLIEGIPEGTQSLALIVDDPDAPSGNWVHWLVWNIAPQFDSIPEGKVPPSALQGTNSFGNESWGGPCPPPGPEHRYFFKLYALDSLLELQRGANKQLMEKAMEGHIISQTQLVGRYGRGR